MPVFSWKKALWQGAAIAVGAGAACFVYPAWLRLREVYFVPDDFQYRDSRFVVAGGNTVLWIAAAAAVLAGITALFAGIKWAVWRRSARSRLQN